MIKAYIFDLDGTLLDRDSSLKGFISNQYEQIFELQSADKMIYTQKFIELDSRGNVWKDRVYSQLVEEFGLKISSEDLLSDYVNNFRYHCIGFTGLHDTLNFLHQQGAKLAVISNGFGEFQLNNIKALGIDGYFQTILISEMEGIKKPDEEIFSRALIRLGVNPEEAFYIGDHPENDIRASRSVGMRAIWKEDSFYHDNFERDESIKDLIELKDIFARYSK